MPKLTWKAAERWGRPQLLGCWLVYESGEALTLTCFTPWLICWIVYSLLHFTYPRDLKRVKPGARKASKGASNEAREDQGSEGSAAPATAGEGGGAM